MDIAEARKLHDDLLATQPEGARHDRDICLFCVDKATEDSSTASRIPPATGSPDVSENQSVPNEHGGRDTPPMTDMTKETHEALQAKAVADAVATTEKALETATAKNTELAAQVEKLESDNASLKADNDRLNGELDSAQVSLKAAQDEVASLKADIAKKEEDAAKAETASKRAAQVRNLNLFDDKFVEERASSWADMAEEDWAARLDEWKQLKPASEGETKTTETASAITGTSESLTKESGTETASADSKTETKTPARRAALGLN